VKGAALQDAAQEVEPLVEPLVTALEPVAELVEVGLQVRGTDAMETSSRQRLTLEGDNVHPGPRALASARPGCH